jgi:hypothetical protein
MNHPCRPGRCHLEDGPAITPADAQRIAYSATLSAMLHDPGDGSVLDIIHRLAPGQYSFTNPATGTTIAPQGNLPQAGGSVASTHDAEIDAGTIQRALGERLDLHFAVWVALHNGWNPEIRQLRLQRQEVTQAA